MLCVWQAFEEKLRQPPASQMAEKKKRELFRKLVQGIIAVGIIALELALVTLLEDSFTIWRVQ